MEKIVGRTTHTLQSIEDTLNNGGMIFTDAKSDSGMFIKDFLHKAYEIHGKNGDFFYVIFDKENNSLGFKLFKEPLATVEELILTRLVESGYVIGSGNWSFKVDISSLWKSKKMVVNFTDEKGARPIFVITKENTIDMYNEAIEFFTNVKYIKGEF